MNRRCQELFETHPIVYSVSRTLITDQFLAYNVPEVSLNFNGAWISAVVTDEMRSRYNVFFRADQADLAVQFRLTYETAKAE